MQILCHWHCYITFYYLHGPSYLRNQQRRAFAKLAWRVIFASSQPSHHRVASALSSQQQFCLQTAEEQDKNSHAKASSSLALQPVVFSQYRLSKFQEEEDWTRSNLLEASLRYLQSTRTLVQLLSQAVSARPLTRLFPPIPGNLESGSKSSTKPNITWPICARLCLNEM